MINQPFIRRKFLSTSATAVGCASLSGVGLAHAQDVSIQHTTKPRRLLKTLKLGMVRAKGDLKTKFQVAKNAGFDGIELGCPGVNVDEVNEAVKATGLVVDGSVGNTHWSVTHSHPEQAVRDQALKNLEDSIRETKACGGHTVLLVVGVGKDGSEKEVWQRSVENISKALPLCAELGIIIAIENVWNQFCYEHDGPADQSAEKFVQYVDEFDSPWIGMQFDIGNHWKYGNPAEWIRTLGKRIVKFDIKGFHRQKNRWADITEDDIPWADVRQAIDDIGFHGWIAAEVGGGDEERLRKVAKQMDAALNIEV